MEKEEECGGGGMQSVNLFFFWRPQILYLESISPNTTHVPFMHEVLL